MEALLTGDVLLRAGVTARLAHLGRTRGEEPDGRALLVLEQKGLPLLGRTRLPLLRAAKQHL